MSNSNEDEDFEWDESNATVTGYSLSKTDNKLRGKRTYGKRGNNTFSNKMPMPFPSSAGNTSTNANNSFVPPRASGQRKIQSLKHEKSSSLGDISEPCMDMTASGSSSSLFPSTAFQRFYDQSYSSRDLENLHPNTNTSGGGSISISNQASLTITQKSSSSDIGFHDSLSFSTHSGTCFSSISRRCSNSALNGFAAEETGAESSGFLACLTPSRSVSSSSRKRGVCESPQLNYDDLSSSSGISANVHNSTSSYGSSRRARSRIFSPESTKKIMEKAARAAAAASIEERKREMANMRKKNESFNDSETELEENDASFIHNASFLDMSRDIEDIEKDELFSTSCRTSEMEREQHIFPLPLRTRRISSVGDAPFEEAILTSVEITEQEKYEVIFNTMSSYEDLKFIVKELRRWSSGKLLASFGMSKNCTIVPPNSWPSTRRLAFIHWTTARLGFCHRFCGAGVNYLQTSVAKAKEVHQDLEDALLRYKQKSRKEKKCSDQIDKYNKTNNNNNNTNNNALSKAPLSSIKIISSLGSITDLNSCTPKYTPMSIDKPPREKNCDMLSSLTGHFNSMNLEKLSSTNNNENNEMDYHTEEGEGSTPLARMVTLSEDCLFSSAIKTRPPRYSHDNSVMDTGDFVSQMHGISPQVQYRDIIRPALHIPRRKNSGGSAIQNISPAIPIINSALSFDQLETPSMPKLNVRKWGSRPIEGKDWGNSEQCEEAIIGVLTNQYEASCSCLGQTVSDHFSSTPSCFVRPEFSGIRADSKSLGIEFEIDHSPRLEPLLDVNDPETDSSSEKDDENTLVDDVCMYKEDLQIDRVHNNGDSDFAELDCYDQGITPLKVQKRREKSYAKRNRISICNSAMKTGQSFRLSVMYKKPTFAVEADSFLGQSNTISFSSIRHVRQDVLDESSHLFRVFSYLNERDLQCSASLVSSAWADVATDALASLMLISVGYSSSGDDTDDDESDVDEVLDTNTKNSSIVLSMQRPWDYLLNRFPWGSFLSEGAFKRVFRVWNSAVQAEEAVSVMDVNKIHDKNMVGNELAVSVMLSSLARRHVCPNFVLMRGVFTSAYAPSRCLWGSETNKAPQGKHYNPVQRHKRPHEPPASQRGLYQYIRMELCQYGDVEEFMKTQPDSLLSPEDARHLLFQMAFSLHVAGDKFGMKHYDVKLLNFFLQSANQGNISENEFPHTILRYGLGSHVFNIKMPTSRALVAKLADFGTANIRPESNGQPVMLSNFTTLENTPPDFMILGDAALQGYGHDSFGLGLCMLHLFTGDAPYEEILETVTCPPNFKKKLEKIWEANRVNSGYNVIRSVILHDVYEDEDGNQDGEPDGTLYDTLYRYLVLFGIPEKFQRKEGDRIWNVISQCFDEENDTATEGVRRSRRNYNHEQKNKVLGLDSSQYQSDRELFSLSCGKDERIARARANLEKLDGGMYLLLSLVSFDPNRRASPLDVINSTFMAPLREDLNKSIFDEKNKVYLYLSYSVC